MFDSKTSALDNDQEILANMLGLNNAAFEIYYHAPSADAGPLAQWFKNHYKKVALHAMNLAMKRKHVRIKSLSIAFQNVIFRSVPQTGSLQGHVAAPPNQLKILCLLVLAMEVIPNLLRLLVPYSLLVFVI